jgi:hypothetical protein
MLVTPVRQEWAQCRMPFFLCQKPHDHVAHGFVVRNERLKRGSHGNIGGHRSARYSFCTDEIYDGLNKSVLTAEQADYGLSCGPGGDGHLVQGNLVYPAAQKKVIKRGHNSPAKALSGGGAGSLTVRTLGEGHLKILIVIRITDSSIKYE